MIKHLIKIDGELFEIPLKVYNHLEQQKQRADQLQKQLNEKSEGNKSLLNRIDELTTVIAELHISNSGFCEQTELSKLRADRADKLWSELWGRLNDVWMNGDADEHEYAFDVLKLMQKLEEDGE